MSSSSRSRQEWVVSVGGGILPASPKQMGLNTSLLNYPFSTFFIARKKVLTFLMARKCHDNSINYFLLLLACQKKFNITVQAEESHFCAIVDTSLKATVSLFTFIFAHNYTQFCTFNEPIVLYCCISSWQC